MIQGTLQFTEEEKRRALSHTDRILRLLRCGEVSSRDLIQITHRFSACIRNLVEQGYQIDVEKQEDGTSIHTLIAYTPLVKVTEEMKLAYYLTSHWHAKRFERMSLDDFRCCHCRKTETLQVHHWVYELFSEAIEDLVTLCDDCHGRIHEYDCVKLHFPKYVSKETASQMTTDTPTHCSDCGRSLTQTGGGNCSTCK